MEHEVTRDQIGLFWEATKMNIVKHKYTYIEHKYT